MVEALKFMTTITTLRSFQYVLRFNMSTTHSFLPFETKVYKTLNICKRLLATFLSIEQAIDEGLFQKVAHWPPRLD